jgi:hypothetical protein
MKAKYVSQILGVVIISSFFVNFGLAYAAVQVPVPFTGLSLPFGMSRSGVAPRNIFMFTPEDIVGKPPPEGAQTIPLETFQDLEGGFWNGMPNTQYRAAEVSDQTSKFWETSIKASLDDPGYYGTPRGVAVDIWSSSEKRSLVAKDYGLSTAGKEQFIKDFCKLVEDKKTAQDLCLKLKEGYFITAQNPATVGGAYPAGSFGMYTVGFKPFSDLWDPRITGEGVAGLVMLGVHPDLIIDSMRKQGYSDPHIRVSFERVLAAHGTSFEPDITWGSGNMQAYWGVDSKTGEKTAPVICTVPEPTWMEVSSDILARAGGKLMVPDGKGGWYEVTKPVLLTFSGIPPEEFFRLNKLDIGVLKGGRDDLFILHGDYLHYLQTTPEKKGVLAALQSSPTMVPPPGVLADYADWCLKNGKDWLAVGGTSLPPSEELKKILGDAYLGNSPSPVKAELQLYLKGDSLAQKVFSNPKGAGGLSPEEQQLWKEAVKKEYTDSYVKFMETKISSETMGFYAVNDYVKWLRDMGRNADADRAVLAYDAERKADWSGFLDRCKEKSPDELGAVDSYQMRCLGNEWNEKTQTWEKVDLPKDTSPPAPSIGNPEEGWTYAIIRYSPSEPFTRFMSLLQEQGFKVSSQLSAVKLPLAKVSAKPLKLRNLEFTMRLFSPDFSQTRPAFSLLGNSQVPFTPVYVDTAWWLVMFVGILLVGLPAVNWKKLLR